MKERIVNDRKSFVRQDEVSKWIASQGVEKMCRRNREVC